MICYRSETFLYIKLWEELQKSNASHQSTQQLCDFLKRMNRSAILSLTLCAVILGANAWCFLWDEGGTINMCNSIGQTNCVTLRNSDWCQVIESETFVSGFTGGNYGCRIFKDRNCDTLFDYIIVGTDGWNHFPFIPEAFQCPCVLKKQHKVSIDSNYVDDLASRDYRQIKRICIQDFQIVSSYSRSV